MDMHRIPAILYRQDKTAHPKAPDKLGQEWYPEVF